MSMTRTSTTKAFVLLALCCAGLGGSPNAVAQTAPTLPGGASSLTETHGDWTVACALQDKALRCGLSQQQSDPKSRQRMLAVELALAADGKADGALVLPFGLALDKGVVPRIDDGKPMQTLPFRTCLPAGCIVS